MLSSGVLCSGEFSEVITNLVPVNDDFIYLCVAKLDDDVHDLSHVAMIDVYLVANTAARQEKGYAHGNNDNKLLESY
jgi:hypothetical protein